MSSKPVPRFVQDLRKYRALFTIYDENGDGLITADEYVSAGMTNTHGTAGSANTFYILLAEFDKDGDGALNWKEFLRMQLEMREVKARAISYDVNIEKIFDSFDMHKRGFLSRTDLRQGLQALGYQPTKQDIVDLMNAADLDGDHCLSFGEFEEFCKLFLGAEA